MKVFAGFFDGFLDDVAVAIASEEFGFGAIVFCQQLFRVAFFVDEDHLASVITAFFQY